MEYYKEEDLINKNIFVLNKIAIEIINNPILMAEFIFHSFIGLKNIGLTCYMDSALQILFRCYNFILEILSIKEAKKITNSFKELLNEIIYKLVTRTNINNRNDLYPLIYSSSLINESINLNISISPNVKPFIIIPLFHFPPKY